MKKRAFTLAEVLITLGIIGVVAAITMPTLIQNHRKHVVETRLKNEVSLIQNSIRMAEARHGFINEWEVCSVNNYDCIKKIFETYLSPELKVIKICEQNSSECWTTPKTLDNGSSTYLSESDTESLTAILANGSSLLMWVYGMTSEAPGIQLWFDVDGPDKGLGRIGGDVFGMKIDYKKGITLNGQNQTQEVLTANPYGCSKDVTGMYAGRYCLGLIVNNGWKIPDDYPIKF